MGVRASIILVAYGRRDMTLRCLESLEAALGDALGRTYEVVVVDNASPDDTLAMLDAWRDRVTVLALPANRDFAGGCNAGAEIARGEILLFLNNDTIVAPGTIEPLCEQALVQSVGGVGARLLYPDRTIQHAGVWMVRDGSDRVMPYHLFQHEDGDLPAARQVMDVECVTAACLAMPRPVFEAVGGFDPIYRNGWEDVDLCLRVRMTGARIVYRGDVAIVHDEGATRGRGSQDRHNPEIFHERWAHLLDHDLETLNAVWDAIYAPMLPRSPGGDVLVTGRPAVLGDAGGQVRATIAGLTQLGYTPATEDAPLTPVGPRLTREEWEPVAWALTRIAGPDVPVVDPAALSPVILRSPGGPGGCGTLVILPAHDLEHCAALLDEAARQPGPIGLWPTARIPTLEALAAERAPSAELLPVRTSERALAARAAVTDVVLTGDPTDRHDRAALVCAAAGAAVVCRPDGPASAILGDAAVAAGPEGRAARRRRVAERCAPEVVLAEIVRTTAVPA